MQRRFVVTAAAALLLSGCFESTMLRPDGSVPMRDARPDPRTDADVPPPPPPPPPPTRDVDVLFVVDNSSSMGEEQASLRAELDALVRVLSTGDFDGDGALGGPDDFTPVESLHLGVISPDMGVGGFAVPTCARADFGDDGILSTRGATDTAGCMAVYPSFLAFRPDTGVEPSDFAADAACLVAGLGTSGYGFEQPLEAALKALSPGAPTEWTADGYAAPMFFRNTFGHGDGMNSGFLRPDSILAVVVVTDEEDCSARDPAIFDPSSSTYGSVDLSLRCWAFEVDALHRVERYVDGLLQLRRHPSRLVFGLVAGVPTDLASSFDGETAWDRLLGPTDGTRDERMVQRVDPTLPSRMVPSCNVPGRGLAFPPIRMLRVGRGLEERGAAVTVESICQESFAPVIRAIVRRIGR